METFANNLIEMLMLQADFLIYFALFMSAVIENLFPPIPGDTITLFGAFMVGTGRLSYSLVYLCTTIGSVVGFMLLVLIGRLFKRDFFIEKNYRFFPAERIIQAEQWFGRWGYFVVLGNRFMPGIRSVISIVSGITRLNLLKVFVLALLSAAVWNFIWIHAGFLLGNNWDFVRDRGTELIHKYNIATGIAIAVIIAILIIRKRLKKRKNAAAAESIERKE